MKKNLHKVRNQRLNLSNNTSKLDKGFNITTQDKKTKLAENFVIDCNKRGKDGTTNKKPRMTQ